MAPLAGAPDQHTTMVVAGSDSGNMSSLIFPARALAEARRRVPHQQVGSMGFSMGTLVSAKAAATKHCDFLITDSYVANPQGVVA